MTDQSPTGAQPGTAPAAPGLRFRTPYRRAEQASTAADAYAMVLAAEESQDRARMLLALARRPDLTAKVLNKIADNHQLGSHSQWVTAMFRANKRIAQTQAAQQFINRDVLPLLLTFPEGIEEVLVRQVVGMHVSDPLSADMVTLAKQTIGTARVNEIVTALLHESDRTAMDVASSALLTDDGWDILMSRLPRTKKAAREQSRDLTLQRLIDVLIHRSDINEERTAALLKAIGTGMDSVWRLASLLRNPHCPKAVYLIAASGTDKPLADVALGADGCTDEARFAGVLAGRPYAAIKVHSTMPVEVAHRALDDAHTIRATAASRRKSRWGDEFSDANEATVVDAVTRYSTDPGVMQRCLDHHLSRKGLSRPEALKVFYTNLLWRHSPNFHDYIAVEPRDHAMDFLAGHPHGDVRALVVPEIDPEEFDAVRADPSGHVRAALVTRQAKDPHSNLAWAQTDPSERVRAALATAIVNDSDADVAWIAADPSPRVRMVLATAEFADPAGWLPLAHDPDERIATVVGERILEMLAEGKSLPETA